jgi:hypothetical protein
VRSGGCCVVTENFPACFHQLVDYLYFHSNIMAVALIYIKSTACVCLAQPLELLEVGNTETSGS